MLSRTKKIKQDELRRFMNLHKKKLSETTKRIESPLARYDEDGTLNCVICQTVVRSEGVWSVHLNSKKHKDNVASKVKKKAPVVEPQQNVFKRPAPQPPLLPVSPKKIKSILKNAHPPPPPPTPPASTQTKESPGKSSDPEKKVSTEAEEEDSHGSDESSESNEGDDEEAGKKDVIPEGFFDDPKLDAKVRNVEYKDPVEEEWEQFQKEIREETSKAQQIIAEDQEEATTERQIDEIDEQMRNWNSATSTEDINSSEVGDTSGIISSFNAEEDRQEKVVTLEKKKKEVISAPAVPPATVKEEDSSGDEDNFEEFLDWRAKRSFN